MPRIREPILRPTGSIPASGQTDCRTNENVSVKVGRRRNVSSETRDEFEEERGEAKLEAKDHEIREPMGRHMECNNGKKQNGRNDRGTDPTCCVEKTATQEPLLRMARATLGPDTGGWTDGGTDRPTERRAPRKHSTSADVHWVPDFRAPLPPRFASSDDFPSTGSAMMTTTTTTQVPGTRRRRRLDRPTSPLCIGRELQWSGRVQDNRRQHHLETKHVDAFRHFSSP